MSNRDRRLTPRFISIEHQDRAIRWRNPPHDESASSSMATRKRVPSSWLERPSIAGADRDDDDDDQEIEIATRKVDVSDVKVLGCSVR